MSERSATTFEGLKTDERYKRLERTLKMVMLKTGLNFKNGPSPSISSIHSDHLDTSCAAMSMQSYRSGSEVLASSSNLKNIIQSKNQFLSPYKNLETSSGKRFSMDKDDTDSIAMPPPCSAGRSFDRRKRLNKENSRTPLLNEPSNEGKGFSMSTPLGSIANDSLCPGNPDPKGGMAHERSVKHSAKVARTFSRWRVMLNDNNQLIVKGTLECGKVARSKPVIRRLSATSLQSIYKHTYHLQGNLVDERNELPDYIRGKFFNGFPDDWENAYYVWRNYVMDSSKLSFRWPTPITDSDDDLKSELTEVSFFRKIEESQSASPNQINATNTSTLSCEPNDRTATPRPGTSMHSLENPSKSCPINVSNTRPASTTITTDRNKSANETCTSLDSNQRNCQHQLQNIIQEDKLNIIIENLTNKNCSIEYIQKIVEMFDCMKFVVSYQTDESHESEKNCSVPKSPNVSRKSQFNGSTDDTKISHHSASKSNHSSIIDMNVRRKLNKSDHDSSESDGDYYAKRRKGAIPKNGRPAIGSARTSYRHKNDGNQYRDDERPIGEIREPKQESSVFSSKTYDRNRRNEETFTKNQSLTSPRKIMEHDSHRMDRESSVSLSEHESVYYEKKRDIESTRPELNYSSVNTSEDERIPVPNNRRKLQPFDQPPGFHYGDSNTLNIKYSKYNRSNNINHRLELHSRPMTSGGNRNSAAQMNVQTTSAGSKLLNDIYEHKSMSNPMITNQRRTNPVTDGRSEQENPSIGPSSDSKSPERVRFPNRRRDLRNRDIKSTKQELNYSSVRTFTKNQSLTSPSKMIENESHRMDRESSVSLSEHDSVFYEKKRDTSEDERMLVPNNRRNLQPLDQPPEFHYGDSNIQNIKHSKYNRSNNINNRLGLDSGPMTPDENQNSAAQINVQTMSAGPKLLNDVHEHGSTSTPMTANQRTPNSVEPEKKNTSTRPSSDSKSPDFQRPTEITGSSSVATKNPHIQNKPTIISSERVNFNLHNLIASTNINNNNNKKAADTSPEKGFEKFENYKPLKNLSSPQIKRKNSKVAQLVIEKLDNSKNIKKQINTENEEQTGKGTDRVTVIETRSKKSSPTKFGSLENPKQLTAWIPAVIREDEDDSVFRLIFEGKLLNEAGHITDRKFVTGTVKRRVKPRLIETDGNVFYELIGDFKDTKRMVPKELVKQCSTGCPANINKFCEKWKSLMENKTPGNLSPHNTLIDCLSVPMSSRGRRILPPLSYWTGERITTRDNKTLYDPGSSLNQSISTARGMEKEKSADEDLSPKKRNRGNKDKPQTTRKSPVKSLAKKGQSENPRTKERRSARKFLNYDESSSESEEEKVRPARRNRKTKANDPVSGKQSMASRNSKSSDRNKNSPQSPDKKSNLLRLKKRPLTDGNDEINPSGPSKRPAIRGSGVTCTFYANATVAGSELSEDQLSIM